MSRQSYDRVAITLHWLMALCIVGMLALGFFMEDFKPISLRFAAINFHKALGITLLALTFIRLYWRITHTPPALPAHMNRRERFAAQAAHWVLYAFMVGMPMSGWVMTSAAAKYKITYFGLFDIPFLPIPDAARKTIGGIAHEGHELMAYGLIALLMVHVLAALKHHFFDRDTVLSHMIPLLKRG